MTGLDKKAPRVTEEEYLNLADLAGDLLALAARGEGGPSCQSPHGAVKGDNDGDLPVW